MKSNREFFESFHGYQWYAIRFWCWLVIILLTAKFGFWSRNWKQIIFCFKYMYFPGASRLQINFGWISSYGWRVVNNFPVNFMFERCWNRLRYLQGFCFKNFPSFWKIAMQSERFCKLAIFWAFVKDLESGHKITFKNKLKKCF